MACGLCSSLGWGLSGLDFQVSATLGGLRGPWSSACLSLRSHSVPCVWQGTFHSFFGNCWEIVISDSNNLPALLSLGFVELSHQPFHICRYIQNLSWPFEIVFSEGLQAWQLKKAWVSVGVARWPSGLLPHATKVAAVLPRIKGVCVCAFFLIVGVAFTVFTTHHVEVVVLWSPLVPLHNLLPPWETNPFLILQKWRWVWPIFKFDINRTGHSPSTFDDERPCTQFMGGSWFPLIVMWSSSWCFIHVEGCWGNSWFGLLCRLCHGHACDWLALVSMSLISLGLFFFFRFVNCGKIHINNYCLYCFWVHSSVALWAHLRHQQLLRFHGAVEPVLTPTGWAPEFRWLSVLTNTAVIMVCFICCFPF